MDKQIRNRKSKIKIASILSFVVILTLLCQCATQPCRICEKDGEEIRKYMWDNEWWDYYERGLSFVEEGCFEEAIADFDKAIEQRDKDQWTARVEGVNFIDYFPHRELGVGYYLTGEDENLILAKDALEKSLEQTPTAKTLYYLERIYQKLDKKNLLPDKIAGPNIIVEDLLTREDPIILSGNVKDKKYIREISIRVKDEKSENDEGNLFFEPVFILNSLEDLKMNLDEKQLSLLEKKLLKDLNTDVSFRKQLFFLSNGEYIVEIKAKNTTGATSKKKIRLHVDRIGPTIMIYNKASIDSGSSVLISGLIRDDAGISEFFIDGKEIPVNKDVKEFTFSEKVKMANKFALIAKDSLGNKTISTQKILSSSPNNPVLLASNSLLVTQPAKYSDTRGPSIELNVFDGQIIHGDKIYIEVGIEDDSMIKKIKISVNDRKPVIKEAFGISGSFTEELRLDSEDDSAKIVIEAVDEKSNLSKKIINIRRKPYKAFQLNERLKILVCPFKQFGSVGISKRNLQLKLIESLASHNIDSEKGLYRRFQLPSRELIEHSDSSSLLNRYADPQLITENSRKLNEIKKIAYEMGYRCVLIGHIEEGEIQYSPDESRRGRVGTEIVARIYDTEKRNYIENLPIMDTYKEEPDYDKLIREIAQKINTEFPFASSPIKNPESELKENDILITDLYNYSKIRANYKLIVHIANTGDLTGRAGVLKNKEQAKILKTINPPIKSSENKVVTE